MGIQSWEIIKTIQQLSIFKKLLFLLPINKTQLIFGNNIEYERKNESAIDKYITLGTYFDLKQDYLGILNELNFDENDAQLINKILNVQIKGYNLSIRLVERAFLNNKIKESFDINKYEGLKLIRKIWNANIINEIIIEDIKELKKNYTHLFSIFNNRDKINSNSITSISSIGFILFSTCIILASSSREDGKPSSIVPYSPSGPHDFCILSIPTV